MKCPECNKGYRIKLIPVAPGDVVKIKEWCEECRGSGEIPHDGDRNGVEWEGE